MREFLVAILAMSYLATTIFLVWVDHTTSGRITKSHGASNTVLITAIFLLLCYLKVPEMTLVLRAMAISAVVSGAQYFWYVGFLSSVRRRRVLKLRQKWEEELAWLDQHRETLAQEAVALFGCSSTTRDPWSRQNAWVAEQDDRRRRKLEQKLKNITP